MAERFTIVGRSSSHFTRVVRMFAVELGVAHAFEVVHDLRSLSRDDYAGNPALRLPILKTEGQVWFGALAICRELARASTKRLRIVWPEQLTSPLTSNAQELTLQAMASGVELIMGADADHTGLAPKRRASLENSVRWLDENVDAVLAGLPERDLSYLETTLFCLTGHLRFRQVLSTDPFARLRAFCDRYGERAAAQLTPFTFDAARAVSAGQEDPTPPR